MHKIRVQIQALAIVLVVFAVFITVAPVLLWALQDGDDRLQRSLTARGTVFDSLMQARAQQLRNTVRLASNESKFSEAASLGDETALQELLEKRVREAGAELALFLDLDGRLLAGNTSLIPARVAFPGLISRAAEQGLARTSLNANGQSYEMVTVPLRDPLPLGWLAIGYRIDSELASVIKNLTGLDATIFRTAQDGISVLGSSLGEQDLNDLATELATIQNDGAGIGKVTLGNEEYASISRHFFPESPDVSVLLKESVAMANEPYSGLRVHIIAVSFLGLLLAMIGASLFARRIGEPMQQLVSAARRIREGDYATPVIVRSRDELGELAVSFNAMQEGIAEREERITYQAQFDELTGLPNRLLALDRLAHAINRADEAGSKVSLLVIDLNSFAEIGSSLGHEIGDALLAQAAERLRASLDARFVLARLEVDEFLAVLEDVDPAEASNTAEELLRILEAGLSVRDLNVSLDACVGISSFPQHGAAPDKLLLRATVAKNDAKAAEADIRIYEDGRDDLHVRHVTILGDLPRAVRQDELKLFLQPKVNLADGSICGAEALVRWDHPTLGFLTPNEFIPLAEQSGNISLISRWALTAAIRECRLWQEEGLKLDVSVNLSGRDLQNQDLPCFISEVLRDHDLNASQLVLEITEQALVRDLEDARRVLECLRALGAHIAIDDFGTGYSSLVQIKNLPVDEVKIDRSFVMELPGNRADVAIVRAAIALAHSLGMEVLAEGVKNRATMRWLAAHGCERAQGFLISKPMPAEQFVGWLADYNEELAARVESGHAQVDLGFAGGPDRRLRTAG